MKISLIPTTRSVLIAASLATVMWASAGSLTPPPGPVAPTMKNLLDVEPRTAIRNDFVNITPVVISFPGSYYLAEDILAIHSQHGIEITASNVTLDLNGFTVQGNLEVGSLDGIHVTGVRTNVTIRNGVVRNFFGDGVDLGPTKISLIEQVQATSNGARGIVIADQGIVDRCDASGNGNTGIVTGNKAIVSRCVSTLNALSGIVVGNGSVVSNCAANDNASLGISASLSTIEHCTATGNDTGIAAGDSKILTCTASNNTNDGIRGGGYVYGNECRDNGDGGIVINFADTRVDSNNVTGNVRGIDVVSSSNLIIRNSASGNSDVNYEFAGGNTAGPIVNSAGIAASSNPHANYDY